MSIYIHVLCCLPDLIEPNSYYHKFNKRVKAEQMVTDTAHLQYMLEYGARYRANYVGQGYSMAEKEYDNLRVIGPETTSHKGGIKYYVKLVISIAIDLYVNYKSMAIAYVYVIIIIYIYTIAIYKYIVIYNNC